MMKRLALVISIIILMVMLAPGFSSFASSSRTPHENPALAKSSFDQPALLFSYGRVFALASIQQYQNAQSLLAELEKTDLPDELRYITERYHALSRQLFTSLDNLASLLDEVSALLSNNQLTEAKGKLDRAEAITGNARMFLDDIGAATNTLAEQLGILAAPAASQMKQAYDRLEENLRRLRQLLNELARRQQDLANRYQTQAVELLPTELSLSPSPASVFVGESITATGTLSSASPLPQRKITLFLDNAPVRTILTSADGAYTTDITIPYKYVPRMTLKAVYLPSGDDMSTYRASQSLPVVVETRFYDTPLEVLTPKITYPGLPFTIRGQIGPMARTTEHTIKILLDNARLAEETVRGEFSLEIMTPPQTAPGRHHLTVVASPRGYFAGTSRRLPIDVARFPLQMDIQVPKIIVLPKAIKVSGRVSQNLASVVEARVSVAFRRSSATTKTTADGSFTAFIAAPFDLSLAGPQKLTITVAPAEPWYAPLEIRQWVFTVNPSNLVLMLVAFLSLGLLTYHRVRLRMPVPGKEPGSLEPAGAEKPSVPSLPRTGDKFTGSKGKILSAYLSGLEAVEQKTGTLMAAHTTLREYLIAVAPHLPRTIKLFTVLTTIAELALYSTHRLDEGIATRAEKLAATIKKEGASGEPA